MAHEIEYTELEQLKDRINTWNMKIDTFIEQDTTGIMNPDRVDEFKKALRWVLEQIKEIQDEREKERCSNV